MKLSDLLGIQRKVLNVSGGCHNCPRKRQRFCGPDLRPAPFIIVGEAPFDNDVEAQVPFSGQTGSLLRQELALNGLYDYATTNTIHCQPDRNSEGQQNEPTDKETSCCMNQFTINEIENYPIVLLVGNHTQRSFFPKMRTSHLRGNVAYHPDFPGKRFYSIRSPINIVQRRQDDPEVEQWKKEIKRFAEIVRGEPVQWRVIQGGSDFLTRLQFMLGNTNQISLDLETTELKHWEPNERIRSFAVAANKSEAFFAHEGEAHFWPALEMIKNFLLNKRNRVMGAHVGFDVKWLERMLDFVAMCEVIFDVNVLYYHIKQYKQTSLKELVSREGNGYRFLVYQPHLERDLNILSYYNAEDVIQVLDLHERGMQQLVHWPKTLDLYLRVGGPSDLALERIRYNGFALRHEYHAALRQELETKRNGIIEHWRTVDPDFRPVHTSGKDLEHYLFTMKQFPVLKTTTKGPSTDESSLKELMRQGHGKQIIQCLLDLREVEKELGTYVIPYLELVGSDGRIHSNYNNTSTDTGRTSSNEPNCYDGNTEILTKRGWVRFDELHDTDIVAQFNKHTSEISFVVPERVLRLPYHGDLIHFESEQIELMVTSDHRMLFENRKTGERYERRANDWSSDARHLQSGYYLGASESCLTPAQVRVLVALQADGSYHDGGISFVFRKQRKYDRVRVILSNAGVEFTEHNFQSGKLGLRIPASQVTKDGWLMKLGTDKVFGAWLLDLSREALDAFVDEIWYWDGCVSQRTHYSSSVKQNTDWVQAVLSLSGKRARLRPYEGKTAKITNWQVDVINTNRHTKKRASPLSVGYSLTTNLKPRQVPFIGFVYCVTVPDGFIVVRRQNKHGRYNVSISGNCQNIPRAKRIRDLFGVPEGYTLLQSDFSQIELRIAMCLARDEAGIAAYLRGEDLHTNTARVVAGGSGEPTKEQRTHAKILNFSLVYGGTAYTIRNYAQNLYGIIMSAQQSEDYCDLFFSTYPGLKRWHDECNRLLVQNQGWSEHAVGHRFFYKDWNSEHQGTRDHAFRAHINSRGQGPAGYMAIYTLILAQRAFHERGIDARTVGTVHDSILTEVRRGSEADAIAALNDCVQKVHRWVSDWFVVPLIMDHEVGPAWGSLEKWKN